MKAQEFINDAKVELRGSGKFVLEIPYIFYDKNSRKWREDLKYDEVLIWQK